MIKLFISYRQLDSSDITGRIYDHLKLEFTDKNVIKDNIKIPPGQDFLQYIDEKIKSSDVVIVVIGKRWLKKSKTGQRRLDDPSDILRKEIEKALTYEKKIIPVLVDNARMPERHELPASISRLSALHAIEVRKDPDFLTDVSRLVKAIYELFDKKSPSRILFLIISCIVLIIIGIGVYSGIIYYNRQPKPVNNGNDSVLQKKDTTLHPQVERSSSHIIDTSKHDENLHQVKTTPVTKKRDNYTLPKVIAADTSAITETKEGFLERTVVFDQEGITIKSVKTVTIFITDGQSVKFSIPLGNGHEGKSVVRFTDGTTNIAEGAITYVNLGSYQQLAHKTLEVTTSISNVTDSSQLFYIIDLFSNGDPKQVSTNCDVRPFRKNITLVRTYRFEKR